jgi:hypothetical protein
MSKAGLAQLVCTHELGKVGTLAPWDLRTALSNASGHASVEADGHPLSSHEARVRDAHLDAYARVR